MDVLQPCYALNKDYTNQYFQANCYKLDVSYDPSNKVEAFKKSLEWGEKQIPLGIIYQEEKPSYESQISQIKEKPLIEIPLDRNLEELFKKYG
ncbi:MAG: hypothetical protein Q7R43_03635 [Candidatus Daviesbacteria bacterium]|nr:hypothetical protein [Candidatus Daviesbacteria bacterium]